jgi:hypothetical protein
MARGSPSRRQTIPKRGKIDKIIDSCHNNETDRFLVLGKLRLNEFFFFFLHNLDFYFRKAIQLAKQTSRNRGGTKWIV